MNLTGKVIWSTVFFVFLFVSVRCAKKPRFCSEGGVCADDELSLYFQASYDITFGRLKEGEEKLELLINYLENNKRYVGFALYYDFANLLTRLGKKDKAKIYAERATPYVLNPKEAEKLYYLFLKIGDVAKANQIIESYFHKVPSDVELFRIVVTNALKQNDLNRAKELCEIFLSHKPDNVFGLVIYGSVLKNLGDKNKAKEQFEKILNAGFYDEHVLKELIDIYREQRENKKAIEILKKIEKYNPSISIRRELVDFLLDEGMADEAVRYMGDITRSIPEPEVILDWLEVLFKAKRYQEVIGNADAVRSFARDRRTLDLITLMKATSLYEIGKFEEAYEEYSKIDESSDFYQDAVAGKIDSLKEIDVERALKYIEQIDESKITPQIAQSIVYVYREKEDFLKAIKITEDFEKKFESKRNSFIYIKAILLYESGRIKEALEQADILLKEAPSDPNYLNLKGYILCEYVREEREKTGRVDHEKLEEAGRLISKALDLKPDPYIKDSMGWYLFLKGKIDEAEKYIRESVSLVPDDAVLNEHLADILLVKGEEEKALEIYRKAIEKGKPKGIDKIRIQNKLKNLLEKLRTRKKSEK